MAEPTRIRPFEQRVISRFDRWRIRGEVLRSKGAKLRRYAALALGASLALGGYGVPMKVAAAVGYHSSGVARQHAIPAASAGDAPDPSVGRQIVGDLKTAESLALDVTSGIDAAARTVTGSLAPVNREDDAVSLANENVREEYFRTEVPFGAIIYRAARANQISPELLASVVKAESHFHPSARSNRGAQGLMQLVPKTARWMGATNVMNPADNVQAGARYLKYLSGRFDGDQQKMVAAYNAGEGTVRKFDGIPPFRETQNYVDQVLNNTHDIQDEVAGRVAELSQR